MLPLDLLYPILEQLTDRHDWHSCALVSKSFNRAATPLLYSVLESRFVSKDLVYHPSTTLNQRPDLAQHVRHVTETGAVHRELRQRHPRITEDILCALAFCTNLCSVTWIDDFRFPDANSFFFSLIHVVQNHPLRSLTIRTHSDLGEASWAQLTKLTGLRKISIWSLKGPPHVLGKDWANKLRHTLTHLELGVSAFTFPCTELLSHLPLLQHIRLKGAPSNTIPTILTLLPNLRTLDTEYLVSSSSNPCSITSWNVTATLRHLTVRTSSINTMGPVKLWTWIQTILPRPGLETFKLHAFTLHMAHTCVPRTFILELASMQSGTLKHFIAGDAELSLVDIDYLCREFHKLETLVCLVVAPDVASIAAAVERAANLKTLRLAVHWIRSDGHPAALQDLTLDQARAWMLRDENSLLRVIGVNSVVYSGKWIFEEQHRKFQVLADVAGDRWNT